MRCMVAVFQMPVSRPISDNSFTQSISIRERPIVKENGIGSGRRRSTQPFTHPDTLARRSRRKGIRLMEEGQSRSDRGETSRFIGRTEIEVEFRAIIDGMSHGRSWLG